MMLMLFGGIYIIVMYIHCTCIHMYNVYIVHMYYTGMRGGDHYFSTIPIKLHFTTLITKRESQP